MKEHRRILCLYLIVFLFVVLLLLIVFYKLYFLRQPERDTPNENTVFVSPAMGKVIAIIHQEDLDENHELYKKNNVVIDDRTKGFSGATLVSIMMTPRDVHYQKAPLHATLIAQKYEEGHFYNAMRTRKGMRSTFQNEYNNMLFRTPEGYKFRIIQIAGFVARRIVSFLNVQDDVEQGDTIGLIKFGSQVSVILDENFEVLVKKGDKVIDGETIIARKKE